MTVNKVKETIVENFEGWDNVEENELFLDILKRVVRTSFARLKGGAV